MSVVVATIRTVVVGRHNTVLLEHCGTFFPIWLPNDFYTPPPHLSGDKLRDWYTKRAKWRYSVIQHRPGGAKHLICPQCAGRVMTTARTRNPKRANPKLPALAAPDTEYCCDGIVTIPVELLDRYQRYPYGTWAQHTDYNGRNPAESSNSSVKKNNRLELGTIEAFGLSAHTLHAVMVAVHHNLRQTRRARAEAAQNDITTPTDNPTAPHTEPSAPTHKPHRPPTTRAPP